MFRIKLQKIALTFLLCSLGAVTTGFLLYGRQILQPGNVAFQVVVSGIFGGLYAAATRHLPRWVGGIIVAIGWGFALYLALEVTHAHYLREAIWVASTTAAAGLGIWYHARARRFAAAGILVWSLVFALVDLLLFLLLSTSASFGVDGAFVSRAVGLGALIGAGLGLGYLAAEYAGPRLADLKAAAESRPGLPT